jgi:hypothetical protein
VGGTEGRGHRNVREEQRVEERDERVREARKVGRVDNMDHEYSACQTALLSS